LKTRSQKRTRNLQAIDRSFDSGVLALIKLATRDAPAVGKELAYRLQTNVPELVRVMLDLDFV
jgi:hypothetical protein